ncbi:proline-rich protein 36-like [Pollicipes pollicipes]|uniref:proline-rich protein 36-like n=1 Tax=Pollicipes pollicipes TaxID=41117 RepID=UPI0018858269|nr:proline-rich protein 36-like [Pollicipes pollicipes]
MVLRLHQQIKDIRSHLARKMAESGGQSSPEIARYQDELRRLQMAFDDASKLQTKRDKKKRGPKPGVSAAKAAGVSAAPRKPDDGRPKPPPSGARSPQKQPAGESAAAPLELEKLREGMSNSAQRMQEQRQQQQQDAAAAAMAAERSPQRRASFTERKRFREINEAEVNDAVASIMGGGDVAADFSLCVSPEPAAGRRRASSESRPLSTPTAADLSVHRPSAEIKRNSRSDEEAARPGAPDQFGEELDWVMRELMSFNNQRKDTSPSAESLQSAFTPSRSAVMAAFEAGGPPSLPKPQSRPAYDQDPFGAARTGCGSLPARSLATSWSTARPEHHAHQARAAGRVEPGSPHAEGLMAHFTARAEPQTSPMMPSSPASPQARQARFGHGDVRESPLGARGGAFVSHAATRQDPHLTHSVSRQDSHPTHSPSRQDPHLTHATSRHDPHSAHGVTRSHLPMGGSRSDMPSPHAVPRHDPQPGRPSSLHDPHLGLATSRHEQLFTHPVSRPRQCMYRQVVCRAK